MLALALVLAGLLLKGLVFLTVARFVPGITLKSYTAGVRVAAVYAVLTWLLKEILVFISLPFIIVTLGLFLLVLNGFLLWLTDKLMHSFEIRGFRPLALATVLVTVGGALVDYALGLLR